MSQTFPAFPIVSTVIETVFIPEYSRVDKIYEYENMFIIDTHVVHTKDFFPFYGGKISQREVIVDSVRPQFLVFAAKHEVIFAVLAGKAIGESYYSFFACLQVLAPKNVCNNVVFRAGKVVSILVMVEISMSKIPCW